MFGENPLLPCCSLPTSLFTESACGGEQSKAASSLMTLRRVLIPSWGPHPYDLILPSLPPKGPSQYHCIGGQGSTYEFGETKHSVHYSGETGEVRILETIARPSCIPVCVHAHTCAVLPSKKHPPPILDWISSLAA